MLKMSGKRSPDQTGQPSRQISKFRKNVQAWARYCVQIVDTTRKSKRTYFKTLLKMADYKVVALGNLTRKIIISKRVSY